ncbi:expressed protein [Phakopsora pachyrhizi]|uniref:Expressed protein n=1 Tax=Phakopsora pachyrhizi TaxID=170000 RepID=A0AAV0BX60_PHAPC|nr:expressed protein [Phakopsora pachyrhizi]
MHQDLAGYPNPSGSLIASNAPEYTPQPRRYSEVSSHHQQLPPMSHALHTSSWSSAPIGQHPYPSQLLPSPSFPSQDSYSASQASENAPSYYSNNVFSPPPSTWNRQTHSNTPASMTHTHDPGSQPVLRSTSSLSFGAASSHPNYHYSAPQQLPTSPLPHGQSFEAIRPRHQSLPPVPAAKSQLEPFSIQNQLNNAAQLSTNLEGIGEESNTFSAPLALSLQIHFVVSLLQRFPISS